MDLQAGKDLDVVLSGLEQNLKVGTFYSSRDVLIAIARFIGKKVDSMRLMKPLPHVCLQTA